MKRNTRFGVLIGAIAIVAMLSISFVAANSDKARNENALETTLQVSRLSCGSCLATIEGELRKFDGMLDMRADLGRGLVTVSHTELFPPPEIAKAVTAAGYPARVVDTAKSGGPTPPAGNSRGSGCSGCGPAGCGLPVTPPERG
ncbi:MAG: heavy metal-associated domain-containing protein [Desulfurivibrionaceae bacterium]|nr:heavy metal-associated domain-containing protein [Desulfurivibrionaceae bacterium]